MSAIALAGITLAALVLQQHNAIKAKNNFDGPVTKVRTGRATRGTVPNGNIVSCWSPRACTTYDFDSESWRSAVGTNRMRVLKSRLTVTPLGQKQNT